MTCTSPILLKGQFDDDSMTVPCGRCRACRINRVRDWTFRLTAELPYWDDSSFITLTYTEDYVPTDDVPFLNHRDVQLFIKRLRKTLPNKIKYMCAGEYGTETARPHYHLIVFGYWPKDAIKNQFNEYYESDSLTKLWGLGAVAIGVVNSSTCAYTAGYVTKKLRQVGAYSDCFRPPYLAVSKGIGERYAKENESQLKANLYVWGSNDAPMSLPRYYRKKLEVSSELLQENFKKFNQRANNHFKKRDHYLSYLAQKAIDLDKLEDMHNRRDDI